MQIVRIKAENFRNLENVEIFPDEKLNIITGKNAQGKTNLLEAIWLFTGCRSFRGSKEKDNIKLDSQFSNVELDVFSQKRVNKFSYKVKKGAIKEKKVKINGVDITKNSQLFERFMCIIFTPEDLELSKGSPDKRRNFIDLGISQIKPKYIGAINRYSKILAQRNCMLKNHNDNINYDFEIWDTQLCKLGAYISLMRLAYVKRLQVFCEELYKKISGGENLTISLNSCILNNTTSTDEKEIYQLYYKKMQEHLEEDKRLGFTTFGIHRDDLTTKINGLNSRDFGSQGQNRSIALCIKIAQALIFSKECGETPVVLLDDVFSELDASRRKFILNIVEYMQIFITGCDANDILKYKKGKIFYVENGNYKALK